MLKYLEAECRLQFNSNVAKIPRSIVSYTSSNVAKKKEDFAIDLKQNIELIKNKSFSCVNFIYTLRLPLA